MALPQFYSDEFLGGAGHGLDPLEQQVQLPATIGTSSMALPGDRALDAALRNPGAFNPNQTPLAGLTASAAAPLAPDPNAPPPPPAPPEAPPPPAAPAPTAIPPQGPAPAPPTVDPATVAAARARAAGGGGWKPSKDQQELLAARKAQGEADLLANREAQTSQVILADTLDRQGDEAEQRMVERAARRAARDKAIDDQMAQLGQDVEDVKNIRYDAGRVFANPGIMVGAIASALRSGAAERITGRNPQEDALQARIAADFQEQKANAEQQDKGVTGRQNIITMMRAQYGDRDQADAAAEIAHKNAAIAQIEALAAHAKLPQQKAEAERIVANMREGVAKDTMAFKAQAAAAAAAAEEKKWKREMELRKQLESEAKTAAEIGKLQREGEKDVNAETAKIGAELTQQKIPTAMASAERAAADLRKGGSVLNSNPVANSFAQSFPLTYKFLAGDDAQKSQMSFANFKNEILAQKGGSAISENELSRHLQNLQGAGTPEDKLRAINDVIEALKQGEAAIKAGASPKAAAEYERRRQSLSPTVSTEAPSGFIPGGGQ